MATFEQGDPFCFITLAPHGVLDDVTPSARELADEPRLQAAYLDWSNSRTDFNSRLRAKEPAALKECWQRTYVAGSGAPPEGYYRTKRNLRPPAKPGSTEPGS